MLTPATDYRSIATPVIRLIEYTAAPATAPDVAKTDNERSAIDGIERIRSLVGSAYSLLAHKRLMRSHFSTKLSIQCTYN